MAKRQLSFSLLGLVAAGCAKAPDPADAPASVIKSPEAPYRTDRLPAAEPKIGDFPPVEGNPTGIGTPPFHAK